MDVTNVAEAKELAFYPGERPLYEGDLAIITASEPGEGIVHDVEVTGNNSLHLSIIEKAEYPLRTRYEAYFTRCGGSLLTVCNVDLELSPRPTVEDIARTILADSTKN